MPSIVIPVQYRTCLRNPLRLLYSLVIVGGRCEVCGSLRPLLVDPLALAQDLPLPLQPGDRGPRVVVPTRAPKFGMMT